MKTKTSKKGALAILLALLVLMALVQIASAEVTDFPLIALSGDLVADANTQYIAVFSQNPSTKLITAEIMIKNGSTGTDAKPLILNGVATEISFDSRVSPCTPNGNKFEGNLNILFSDFERYCSMPVKNFNTIGSNAIQNNASGRFIGATISAGSQDKSHEDDDDVEIDGPSIAPGTTQTILVLYFTPNNGSDLLDINMFNFYFLNNSNATGLGLLRLSTWLGNGSFFLFASHKSASSGDTYVENPNSFKLHVKRPQPNVAANNSSRFITNYDTTTMEWSYSATSGYETDQPAGGFGNVARTVYVRSKGDNDYSGNDATYGNYKKYLLSDPVEVNFSAVGASTYTITFNYNFGSPPGSETRTVTAGGTVGAKDMPHPTRDGGYVLTGWNDSVNGTGDPFTDTTPVRGSITVYAQWEIPVKKVKVYFDSNGGFDRIQELELAAGTSVGGNMVPDPTRNGYSFEGWNTKSDGTGTAFTPTTIVNETITVYAKWKLSDAPKVTVTFDYNYPGSPSSFTREISMGGIFGDTFPPDPSRSGYDFMGWYDNPTKDNAKLFINDTKVEGNITVYARWTIITDLTVTFNYNYSNCPSPVNRSVSRESSLGAEEKWPGDPSPRTGYRFLGWNTRADGKGDPFISSTIVLTSLTVYAQWEQIINGGAVSDVWVVTFMGNQGNPYSQTVSIEKSRGGGGLGGLMPANPSRNGYTFAGWNTTSNGTGSWFISTTAIDRDITVYAIWEALITVGPAITTIIEPDVPLAGFTADHIPFITGYPDGTVKPDNPITRAEVAMIFFRLLTSPDKTTPRISAFADVPEDIWYTQAVNYLASIEILVGYAEDGTFRPGRNITRAEFAAVASRFDKLEDVNINIFPDIENHWAKAQINSAYAKGWVSGYPEDGTFRPQKNISRAEVVKIVNTMLNRKLDLVDLSADILNNIIKFSDIAGHWAHAHVVEASNNHDFTRKSDGYEIWTRLK
ncbi:MAG: InlB B-repeat-containing protein [Firmicutes bacterium]|nr:InlB B-repeat-containing protein [Bacillota bacterium]